MDAMDLYELVKQDENELEIFLEDHPELFTRIDKVFFPSSQSPLITIPYPSISHYSST